MRKQLVAALLLIWFPVELRSQGTFIFDNISAPTRLGTVDGPFAGPDIWAHALVGLTADSLSPLGNPVQHDNGYVFGDLVIVPYANYGTIVFVQMVAWNGTFWGTNKANVPSNQFGRTDTVSLIVLPPTQSPLIPQFTQPAVVPVIPEPSALALVVFGGAILFFRSGMHARSRATRRDDAKAVHS
jgi:hypothetical protein